MWTRFLTLINVKQTAPDKVLNAFLLADIGNILAHGNFACAPINFALNRVPEVGHGKHPPGALDCGAEGVLIKQIGLVSKQLLVVTPFPIDKFP